MLAQTISSKEVRHDCNPFYHPSWKLQHYVCYQESELLKKCFIDCSGGKKINHLWVYLTVCDTNTHSSSGS